MQLFTLLAAAFHLSSTFTAQASPISHRDAQASGSRTSAPSGCKVVRGSGTQSGEYSTLAAAITALGSGTSSACIFIYSGTYSGQTTVQYGGPLTIYGYTTDISNWKNNAVTFTHSITSTAAGTLDASSTLQIKGTNVKVYNINVANTYGAGSQAVALTANGDKLSFYGCSFAGYQDTLYVKSGAQYFSNCYILGADDFIFGAANVWFGECTLALNGGGSITASSRMTNDDTWYVIDHSTVTAAPGYTATAGVYLGRPWRVLARVIYQNTALSNIINAAGWTTLAAGATPVYEEYANTGAGSSTSARKYETAATAAMSKSIQFGSSYCDWVDCTF